MPGSGTWSTPLNRGCKSHAWACIREIKGVYSIYGVGKGKRKPRRLLARGIPLASGHIEDFVMAKTAKIVTIPATAPASTPAPVAAVEPTKIAAVVASYTGSVITLKFATGTIKTWDTETATPEHNLRARMHGYAAKFVDRAAIPRDKATGRSATNAEKEAAVLECFDRIVSGGDWNAAKAEAAPKIAADARLLARALERIYSKKSPAELLAYATGLDVKTREGMMLNAKVKVVIDAIKAEDEAKIMAGVDQSAIDDMLAGLDAE